MKKINSLMVVLLALLSSGFAAGQQSPISFANIAQKQVISVDANGSEVIELTDVGVVVPGDVVVYTSTFTNIGNEAVSDIVVNNPIPANTAYNRFSAKGANTSIVFSIDGGQSFAAPADLLVTDVNGVSRTANPEEYTNIRWIYQVDLAAGESSSVNFKVSIK